MKLNPTEAVIVNEVMKEWRAYVKPSRGVLMNNPADEFGEYYTYEAYALEWLGAIIAKNDYMEILHHEELENITNEIKKRVAKAEKKEKDGFDELMREIQANQEGA